jgi:hypothetical protein
MEGQQRCTEVLSTCMKSISVHTSCIDRPSRFMQKLLRQYLLDAMHCKKNICENLLKTVLGTKDSYGSRQDMQELGIRRDLWLGPSENERDLFSLPKAPYVLTASKRTNVFDIIKNLKTPSNFVGAIAKCVEEGKLRYMKSHDFHILMQQVSS